MLPVEAIAAFLSTGTTILAISEQPKNVKVLLAVGLVFGILSLLVYLVEVAFSISGIAMDITGGALLIIGAGCVVLALLADYVELS